MFIVFVLVILAIFLFTALIGAPYVPSHRTQLIELFDELYRVKKTDVVLDIGSGDGIVLGEVAKRGAKAVGYEINPVLVVISYIRLYKYRKNISLRLTNFWTANFPDDTTLVYTFGDSRDIKRMYNKVQHEANRLGKTLYFVSYGFQIHDYKPVRTHNAHHLYKITPLQ